MKFNKQFGASLALISAAVVADDSELEQITVTANRLPIESAKTIASQVTITREEIERIQPLSISQLLSSVAGIDIANNGGRGQLGSVFIRGTSSEHVLVMVDGVRVGSATLGSTNLQDISPTSVERIEVVKGPRAAVWGSDAIGGVIHIITRRMSANQRNIAVKIGADNYQSLYAAAGFEHGNGATTLSVNKEKSDGFDVLQGADPDKDGFDALNVAIRGQQQLSKGLSLDWLASVQDNEADYDAQWQGGDDQSAQKNHVWKGNLNYQWQDGQFSNFTTVSLGQNRDYSQNYVTGAGKDSGSAFETRRDQLSLINQTQFEQHWTANFGIDLYQEQVSGSTDFPIDDRLVSAAFAHGLYQSDTYSAELAVRFDDVEDVDKETTYNASIAWDLSDVLQLSLLSGSAFKAPTFNDLYHPFGGNDQLQAEKSDTQEIVLAADFGGLEANLSFYTTDVRNLIEWRPNDSGVWQPENVASAEIEGVEAVIKYQGLGGQHQLNASYLDAKDAATGLALIRRADEQFSYQFTRQFNNQLELFAEYQYVGKRFDTGEVELDSYQLVNMTLSYPFSEQVNAKFRIHNLFDENYQTAANYNTQGRTAYLSVDYSW